MKKTNMKELNIIKNNSKLLLALKSEMESMISELRIINHHEPETGS